MMIIGSLLAGLILFSLSLIIKNRAVGFMSGVLFTISGLYVTIYGFGNVTGLYTQAIAITSLGLGLMIMLVAGVGWMYDGD